jgi:hypothetical protein
MNNDWVIKMAIERKNFFRLIGARREEGSL